MADQRSEYGRSRSMDKRLKALGKPMPDQPKESLEAPDILRVHEHPDTTAHHQTGPHDGCECRVCVLQRQNAALMSALRETAHIIHFGRFHQWKRFDKCTDKDCKRWNELLAFSAPAEAEAKEKP